MKQYKIKLFINVTCRVISTVFQSLESTDQQLQDLLTRLGRQVVQVGENSCNEKHDRRLALAFLSAIRPHSKDFSLPIRFIYNLYQYIGGVYTRTERS